MLFCTTQYNLDYIVCSFAMFQTAKLTIHDVSFGAENAKKGMLMVMSVICDW